MCAYQFSDFIPPRFPPSVCSVQSDIATSLKMSASNMYKVVHPFNRPNLYYEVHFFTPHSNTTPFPSPLGIVQVRYLQNPVPALQMADIHEYINTLYTRRGRPSSGIIYCRRRATCDALAAYLRGKGLNARPYHRGLKCVGRGLCTNISLTFPCTFSFHS